MYGASRGIPETLSCSAEGSGLRFIARVSRRLSGIL